MVFTACNRGSERTEGSTQQQTASEEQTQTDAELSLQTLTGDLSAFAESASENNVSAVSGNFTETLDLSSQNIPNLDFNKIDLLRYINFQDIGYLDQGRILEQYNTFGRISGEVVQIDGFSRSGKVAFLVIPLGGGRGGKTTVAYILDLIEDKIVYRNSIDNMDFIYQGLHYYWDPEETAYNMAYALFLSDYKEKGEKNGIVFSTVKFNKLPINFSNQSVNITIEKSKVNKTFDDEQSWRNDYTLQYKTIAENRGKSKTIKSGEELAYDVFLCGYFMSPFEDRALVIIAVVEPDYEWYPEIKYIFTGCHLTSGFM
jgi:hypothetical protein